MSVDRDALYALLPAIYRLRDQADEQPLPAGHPRAGQEFTGPLRQLLEVLTDELAVLADGVDQLYDDAFVETAAPWALPYLAELIGLRGLPASTGTGLSTRAEVANTIGYRRRKGTAAVLEQVARDVTGWPSRAVEYFELLAATQHVNHVRAANTAIASIRDAQRLGDLGTPFERRAGRPDLTHTVEVRRIASLRGRYNIGNVGIFSWRLRAYPLTGSPAVPAAPGEVSRFHLHPLGIASPLYALPVTEDEITRLAEPVNVPHPLGRRELATELASYYGRGLSLTLPGVAVDTVDVCDLSDTLDAGGNPVWAHTPRPAGRVAIDPVLGRVAYGDGQPEPPRSSFHYGFAADLGGGEYHRPPTTADAALLATVSSADPLALDTIDDGVAAVASSGDGIVEIADSGRYGSVGDLTVTGRLEIRAADRRRPSVLLAGDLVIDGDGENVVVLDGLLIAGGTLRIRNVRTLRIAHCTLVPGLSLTADGAPAQPGAASIVVESAITTVTVERSILGGIRAHPDADVSLVDSICDAGRRAVAYASDGGEEEGGGALRLEACTVLGKVHARILDRVSNSILLAEVAAAEDPEVWPGPVLADRRQQGCVRFSYLPPGSRTPRRYRCQPENESDAARVRPVLSSQRYPDPAYAQLDGRTAAEIIRGADDESEMGAFHHLYAPQRATYLAARLDDYLRFGLEAGFFFAS